MAIILDSRIIGAGLVSIEGEIRGNREGDVSNAVDV